MKVQAGPRSFRQKIAAAEKKAETDRLSLMIPEGSSELDSEFVNDD